jgi:RND family efflux transporter MFP subunit
MDLVPATTGPPAGVEGYAEVTLDATRRQLAGIETAAARSGRLMRTVRTSGTVLPDEGRMQHVHVKAGGYVEKLYVNVTGQQVRRGEPMLVLYSPELLASQEELLRAKRAADEAQSAASPGARTSAEELLAAARRRLVLFDVPPEFLAEVERSGRPQRTVTVHAHAGGYILSKDVIEGELVEPGSELFTINDLERVWVEAAFYESEAPLVRAGQRATVTLPYDAAITLEGRASYVYPSIDPESRTLRVRFEFPNPSLRLRPSMYVDVVLEVEAPEGILVPESAVLDSGERQLVFVETASNRFEPRRVQVGLRSGGLVLVHGGVGAGERVVVRANFLLDSESRLQGSMAAPGGEEHRGHAP